MREDEAIAAVRRAVPLLRDVRGPGDDAAVLTPPAGNLVWAIDLSIEGRHFDLSISSIADAAFKAVARNASDLAAMGADPIGFLAGVTLPEADQATVEAIAEGFAEAADRFTLPLAGGDLSQGERITFSVTVLGSVTGAGLGRDGASAGDLVYVTGPLGAAAAGLYLHRSDRRAARSLLDRLPHLSTAHRRGQARLAEGRRLLGRATSCMDVSDGLVIDLGRLARASAISIEVEPDAVPLAEGVEDAAEVLGIDSWELATAGDDYELVFTSAKQPDIPATRIGRVLEGEPKVTDPDGRTLEGGHEHFS